MAMKIGQLIKEVAVRQGLSQKEFGEKINRTKQGVASIYNRSTIAVDLLILISEKLDFDFFAELYKIPPLSKFKEKETAIWENKIAGLLEKVTSQEKLIEGKDETLLLQRKYITELEDKIRNATGNADQR